MNVTRRMSGVRRLMGVGQRTRERKGDWAGLDWTKGRWLSHAPMWSHIREQTFEKK